MWALTGRWVFPVDQPPLPGGIVLVEGETILAIEPHGTREIDVDLGNVALLPGLVNAHTHLDLTGLAGLCPPTPDFPAWLRGVIGHRRAQTPAQLTRAIATGVAACLRAGVTLVGDIAAEGSSWNELSMAPLRAVVFRELLGLPRGRTPQVLADATTWLEAHPATDNCRPGLSPHAPYSVHWNLYLHAARLAELWNAPLATHLAETQAELELLGRHSGPLAAFLAEMGVWEPEGLAKSPADVVEFCHAAVPLVLAHGNFLDEATALPPSATVVYCPRTHAAFGHPPHPLPELLERGVRVAVGTDSLASNPDLDLLEELRLVHRLYPELAGEDVLRLGTLSGAEALGWADAAGSLTPGKSADVAVVPLDEGEWEPHHLLFRSSFPVARTLFRGQWRSA